MAEESPGGAALSVLVVDDHAIVREAVASMARDAGYVVFEAVSGEQAVELASSVRPDLVIMDVLMPGMSGIEAAGQIAARDPGARVVMLSVADSAETVRAAMRAGAAGYLTKAAASRATVLDALRRTAAGERVFAPPGLVDVLVRDPALLPRSVASQLTLREREIITLAARGVATADIAGALGLSPRTVENHLARIYRKLGITSRTQLAKVVIDQQIDRYPWAGQVCTVMLVDIVAFGAPDRSSRDQLALREAMYQILREAFTRSGIPWPASQMEDRGDGVLIIVPPGVPASTVIGPYLTALGQELGRYNRTAAGSASMRLRVALDAGPVAADALGVSGQAIMLASRLIDAPPFREGLRASGADLGVIVSESVYDTVIRRGGLSLDPAYPRSVDIRVKELDTTAWMWFGGRAPSSGSPEADDIEARLERLRRRLRDSERASPGKGRTLGSGRAASGIGGLYGREDALRLIRDFLNRGGRASAPQPDDDPNPVLLFEGPRGIGKTALLRALADQLDQQVPYASMDCEQFRGDARALLTLLAFDLNRHSGRYGRLRFPRLVTGQIAISAHLETASRPLARDEIRRWLELHQRSGAALSEKVTGELITGLEGAPASWGAGPAVADLASAQGARLILGGHVSTSRGRRLLLRAGQDWYGHQDRGLNGDSLNILVDLNRTATSPHADDRRAVTQTLCAAFLADLQNGNSRKNQPAHCVLLLDNADTAAALDLLDGLRLSSMGQAGPLTVIATSRGGLSARLQGEERAALTGASYADYLRRTQHRRARWLYTVALPGLTRDQTGLMIAELGLQEASQRTVAGMVHDFTAGHPRAIRVLLAAIAEHPDEPIDLPALLSESAAGRHSVEERILSQFLEGIPPAAIDDLATCSAARHREDALRLAARSDLLTFAGGAGPVVFSDELWWSGTATDHAVLHPALRRLLLRRLSMRDDTAPASWTRVCETLKAESEVTGDDTGTMYYALALGDIQYVASRLTRALDLTGASEWLRLLQSVAGAPNRLDHRQPVHQQLQALTQRAEPGQQPLSSVARLLAATWICSDPLSTDHRGELYRSMAEDLQIIAHYYPKGDQNAFYSRITEYRDTAHM